MTQTELLLNRTAAALAQDRKWRKAHARRFAPEFNALKLLEPNENQLSRILAFLLDSNEAHGQGDLFVSLFVGLFDLAGDPATADAKTEIVIDEDRRLDIVVRMQTSDGARAGFVIENKLWASDQSSQVSDYLRHIERENLQCLIYLTREGTEPDEFSIEKADADAEIKVRRLRLMSYRYDLVEWLVKCVEKATAAVVRDFLSSVEAHLRSICIGGTDMSDAEAAQAQCLQSKEFLEASLLIGRSVPLIKCKLLIEFLERLNERVQSRGWDLRHREDFGVKWWKIKRGRQPCCVDFNNGSSVEFDFDDNDAQNFWVGVPRSQTYSDAVLSQLKALAPGNILDGKNTVPDPTSKWLWYRYSTRWNSDGIWWTIKSGQFLDDLLSLIENIYLIVTEGRPVSVSDYSR